MVLKWVNKASRFEPLARGAWDLRTSDVGIMRWGQKLIRDSAVLSAFFDPHGADLSPRWGCPQLGGSSSCPYNKSPTI